MLKEVEAFIGYLRTERNYSTETLKSYQKDLEQFGEFIKPSGLDITEVNHNMVREWVVQMMDDGYTTTSVNRKLSALRTFYRYLLKMGLVGTDPMRKVSGPKNKKNLPVFLKESEMDRLLDETDFGEGFAGCRDRLIIQMFYETGIRLAELVGLNDSDVDTAVKQLKVTGKRNKQRLVPFGDELAQSVDDYRRQRNEALSLVSQPFFVRTSGERITRGDVERIVKRNLSKVVTVKKRSPHVLRHTFATAMLNNDAQLGAIKELLGHESLRTTEVYTHTTFEELKKVYEQAHPRS